MSRHGLIYVLKCMSKPRQYKVGRSSSATMVAGRLSSCQTGCPFPIVLVASAPAENMAAVERRIHNELKARGLHLRGEWFFGVAGLVRSMRDAAGQKDWFEAWLSSLATFDSRSASSRWRHRDRNGSQGPVVSDESHEIEVVFMEGFFRELYT